MVKRVVKEGFKHGTAMYALNSQNSEEIPLNFIDLALHIALTANDNRHRNNYPREKMAKFLAECVDKGYNHKKISYFEDMATLWEDLEKSFKRFYRKLWKKKKAVNLIWELPRRSDETNPPLETFTDSQPLFGVSVPISDAEYEEMTR